MTALELHDRLARVRPDVRVVGVEIDPARVAAARPLERPGLDFRLGGFEVPLEGGVRPAIVRAFNVLRQYDEADVAGAWAQVQDRLADHGLLVDGTCDELGRRSAWVAVGRAGPLSLTLSWRLRGLEAPSDIAERLPKSLIHRNVEGEPVHAYLTALDRAWARAAHHGAFGVRQRFLATAGALREEGWPLLDGPARWRLGEVSVDWAPSHREADPVRSQPSAVSRQPSAGVVVLEAHDVGLVELPKAISSTRPASPLLLAMRWRVLLGTHTASPGAALQVRSPTVTSIGTSRTCQSSPRWSWVCSESRWPGSTVMTLTVTCALETNCWNCPHGRSWTKISSRGSDRSGTLFSWSVRALGAPAGLTTGRRARWPSRGR